MKIKRKHFILLLLLVVCFCLFIACEKPCEHTGGVATCIQKAVCDKCGESYGTLAATHTGGLATCDKKAVCSVCETSYGELGRHNFKDNKCTVCDIIKPTPKSSFTYIIENEKVILTKFIGEEVAVSIPKTIEDFPVTSIGYSTFYNCSSLTSIAIPDGVTSIGDYAFYNCSSLTSITIPDSVTGIGVCAFYYCFNLTSITIGDGVTGIGNYAFYGCPGLTSIVVNAGNTAYRSENDCLISISDNALILGCNNGVIPDGITSIVSRAFAWRDGLTSIIIPDSVTSIGGDGFEGDAFEGCSNLTSIVVNAGNTAYRSENDCLIRIDDNALILGCKNSIIPDGITSIGNGAFWDCEGLTSITIPDSVTSIGYFAFYNCISLTSIIIPDNVTDIGGRAFFACYSLTDIIIGRSVAYIGEYAFDGCSNLTSIVVNAGNTTYRSENNCVIIISDNALILGCKNSVIPDSVTRINENAFSGCYNLTCITIPDSVTSIGGYAFSGCSNLEKVYYTGSSDDWNNIEIVTGTYSNICLTNAARYYYCETQPTNEGNYWHYADGIVTEW